MEIDVGIAAAEVVAAQKGALNPKVNEDAKACLANLESKADPGLISLALKALERIKTNSELKELWDESENPAEWYQAVGNLEARLMQ